MKDWANKILSIKTTSQFNSLAIEAFHYQYDNVGIYGDYCKRLGVYPKEIENYQEIPFLPIEFFKTHRVTLNNSTPQYTFTSSGTTGMQTSKHEVSDINIYEKSFMAAFSTFYGNITNYCVLALLPSYLEREGSSLVYMANTLISMSNHADSGFYLDNYEELAKKLERLNKSNQKVLLLGVTYALLDLAEQHPINLKNSILMETGGMKGRRKELIREELHKILCKSFNVESIHSEYGMTELLSQAYSKGEGIFQTPNWMKILIRDTYDPFSFFNYNCSGGINVIDLANINSCCFIETKDIGKTLAENKFTILGRFDNSDIRGCNLMIS
ncbi:MAG: acyltransferase [Salinivirgaceae bacterium]|jgi:phenylacetate-coenzyme A ligase PaaK-like adenylate-forming protein|nr:acyltransferase [Salinivirgaceae bacterium]